MEDMDITSTSDLKAKQSLRRKRVLELFEKKSTENDEDAESATTEEVSTTNILSSDSQSELSDKQFYNCLYGKKTTKKHKTWDNDGLLEVSGLSVILKDPDDKVIGRTTLKSPCVTEGFTFSVGNFLVEVGGRVPLSEVSNNNSKSSKVESETLEPPAKKMKYQFIPLKPSGSNNLSRFNKLSIFKENNAASDNLAKSVFKVSESKPREKVSKLLHLFDNKTDDTVEQVERPGFTALNSKTQKASNETTADNASSSLQKMIFNVVYGKITTKKHKTYDDDGSLEVEGKSAVLKDTKGNIIGRGTIKPGSVLEGSKLCVGSKEIEVLEQISSENVAPKEPVPAPVMTFAKSLKKSSNQQFVPLRGSSLGKLHNYEPLVMPAIKKDIEWDGDDTPIQEVSVDPCIASVLRPHQRDGLIFLYKCVMGINDRECHGAILADEMGLGKTLQCISLIWTLLKQGPLGRPVLRRVLIVAPSSLCGNWKKEFIRWLGSHRIAPYVVNEKNKAKNFTKFPKATVMIISYEMFVRNFDDVAKFKFDMVVCDEGHRLKNSEVKALKMLNQLETRKRVLLTGTPVQNDLQELYTLADFVNPGVFEDRTQYKKYYENPIVASQVPDAPEDVVELGQERANELHSRTKLFTLRRTNDLSNKYLPPKHDLVIFCKSTKLQETLYEAVTDQWFDRFDDPASVGGATFPLTVINNLKKICNHPSLVQNDTELLQNDAAKSALGRANSTDLCDQSGKLIVLRALMRSLKATPEKLVLVSYFTQTLDILEKVCYRENLKCCRLDGSTSTNSRMQIVEQFNSKVNNDYRVFLLSAKAGGVGLNLPAASRLVLFDSDWNPANDAQAMARIWREGQKRTSYIYRFLTTGTIEEKIYQRQISKTSLSEAVVDSNRISSMKLSMGELKDLFTLAKDSNSTTHDLMDCSCDDESNESFETENAEDRSDEDSRDCQLNLQDDEDSQHLTINQLLQWKHYKPPIDDELLQDLLLQQVADQITFVFKNSSQPEG